MAQDNIHQIPHKLYKGLFLDVSPLEQPEGTYRFALNAMNQTREGNKFQLSTEESTQIFAELTSYTGSIVVQVGSIYISDNEHIIFVYVEDQDSGVQISAIYFLSGYGEIQQLLVDVFNEKLNFNADYPITGEYRLRNGCEKTIYWVDGQNTVKTYNFTEGLAGEYTLGPGYYNLTDAGLTKLELVKTVKEYPIFISAEVKTGGTLASGTYNFAIQYMDENLNETAWLTTSMVIPIYVGLTSGNYDTVFGSSNSINDPTTVVDAAFGSSPSNKKIEIVFDNLSTTYDFYRIAVIEATSGTGLPTRALVSARMPTSQTLFIADGNESKFFEVPVETILLTSPEIGSADHLEQSEERLLFANTQGVPRDYCSYQRFASLITTEYITDTIAKYNYKSLGDSKNPASYFEKIGYMGGEVYAFGIIYIFEDGTESPAYHIPGRPAGTTGETLNGRAEDDTEVFTNYIDDLKPFVQNVYTIGDPLTSPDTDIQYWRVYDTSTTQSFPIISPVVGWMAFWEMQAGNYLYRDNCVAGGEDYWGVDGYDWSGEPFINPATKVGIPIRHHKFPNRNTIPHAYDDISSYPGNLVYTSTITLTVSRNGIAPPCAGSPPDPYDELVTYKIIYDIELDDSLDIPLYGTTGTPILGRFLCGESGTLGYSITLNGRVDLSSVKLLNDASSVDIISTADEAHDGASITIKYNGVRQDTTPDDWETPVTNGGYLDTTLNSFIQTTYPPAINVEYDYLTLLGINFKNITFPDGVKDFRIVRAERDDFNRTVLAKAFSGNTRTNEHYLTFQSFGDFSTLPSAGDGTSNVLNNINNKFILAPENLFLNKNINPQYLKWENRFEPDFIPTPFGTGVIENVNDDDGGIFDKDGYDWQGFSRWIRYSSTLNPLEVEQNHKVEDMNYLIMADHKALINISPSEDASSIRTLWNASQDNPVGIAKISKSQRLGGIQFPDDLLTGNGARLSLHYVAMMIEVDIHPILDNITYYQCHNNTGLYSATEYSPSIYLHVNFGGDTFISHFYLTNTLHQGPFTKVRIWEFIVKALILVIIIAAAVIISIVSWGTATPLMALAVTLAMGALALGATTGVVIAAINAFSNEMANPEFLNIIYDTATSTATYRDDTFINMMYHGHGMWIESDINVGLREPAIFGYKGLLETHTQNAIISYCINKILKYVESEGRYLYSFAIRPEIYRINKDFMRMNKEKVFFALQSTYDCCSNCLESFPNKIFYSERSFLEEKFDSYGKVLPLNYLTIPGDTGEITNIFTISNALYAHTKDGLWYIPQNVQERLTGDVISLIGTGGFFDSTPRRIHDTEMGAAGCTQKLATMKTKHGVFFIDSEEGEVYLMNFSSQTGTQIKSLTADNGMQKWFRENGRFFFYDQMYRLKGIKIPTANPTNPTNGIGFIAAYDYQNNRFLLTKRDYRLIDESSVHQKTFDINDYNLTDPEIFENKSYTISYSLDTGAWTSFHSYLPLMYIYDRKNLISVDQKVANNHYYWQHNVEHKFLNFYGEYKSHIIDYVSKHSPLNTTITDNILIQTEALKAIEADGNDPEYVEQRYITFNKAVIYNTRQSTGEILLNPTNLNPDENYMMRSVRNVTGEITIRKFEKNWRINGFRDMRTDYNRPLFHTTWSEIKDEYFIDKIPNGISIDQNKEWEQREKFMDKYIQIRLIYENQNDVKLLTNYTIETEKETNV